MTRLLFAAVAALAFAAPAPAAIILQNTGGTRASTSIFGQSFTTPAGGPWNNLEFNFFSDQNNTTPAAAGTLFLLTQQYLGTPAALSAATPGFLASTSTINAGVWEFADGVTIQPNTQYFVYTNTFLSLSGYNPGNYPGGTLYFSANPGANFQAFTTDTNFRLAGDVAADVPEPASLAVFGLLAAGGLAVRRRK